MDSTFDATRGAVLHASADDIMVEAGTSGATEQRTALIERVAPNAQAGGTVTTTIADPHPFNIALALPANLTTFSGLHIAIQNAKSGEHFGIVPGDGLTQDASGIYYNGSLIATVGVMYPEVSANQAIWFTGDATPEAVQKLVDHLAYWADAHTAPASHDVVIALLGSDDLTGAYIPAGSPSAQAQVAFPTPVIGQSESFSVAQDTALHVDAAHGVLANDTGNGTLVASNWVGPTNGTLTLNADGSFDYTPNAGFVGTDFFSYAVDDANLTRQVVYNSITVGTSYGALKLGGLAATVTFADAGQVRGAPQLLGHDVYITDPRTWTPGGTLTVSGLAAYDHVSVLGEGDGAGQVGVSGHTIRYGGVEIGTLSGGDGGDLTITFNSAATATAVTAVASRLAYQLGQSGIVADHSLHVGLVDGAGVAVANASQFDAIQGHDYPANPFGDLPTNQFWVPTLGDINGDGHTDLILTGNGFVHWYVPGDPATTDFSTPIYAIVDGALMVKNGDGGEPGIKIYLNDGQGQYLPGGSLATNQEDSGNSLRVALADVNNDGSLDLVVTSQSDGNPYYMTVAVAANDGHGNFGPPTRVTTFDRSDGIDFSTMLSQAPRFASVAAGDIDGDGHTEIFTWLGWATVDATRNGGYLENAHDAYSGVQTDRGDNHPGKSYLYDFDGDGDIDALLSDYGSNRYYRNDGSGHLIEQTGDANPFHGLGIAMSGGSDGFYGPGNEYAFGDLDGDGDLDILYVGPDGHSKILWNNSNYGAQSNSSDGNVRLHFGFSQTVNPDAYTLDEDNVLTADALHGVLANDLIPGTLSAQLVASVQHGTLLLNADGSFVYTPAANYNGADSFTYRVNDGSTLSDPIAVSLTINAVADPVVAVNDAGTTTADGSATLELLANDIDIDAVGINVSAINGSAIRVNTSNAITLPSGATLDVRGDGHLVYTPGHTYDYLVSPATGAGNGLPSTAIDSFTYTTNTGSTATVSVTVTGVDGPGDAAQSRVGGIASAVTFTDAAAAYGTQTLLNGKIYFVSASNWAPGGTLTVSGLASYDHVSILDQGNGAGQVGVSGSTILYGGVAIGTVAGGDGTTLTVSFNHSATAEAVTAVTERIGYQIDANAGTPADHKLQIGLVDGHGVTAANAGQWEQRDDDTHTGFDVSALTSSHLYRAAIGDVNGDGHADLVLSGDFEPIIDWHVVDYDDPDYVEWEGNLRTIQYMIRDDGVALARDPEYGKAGFKVLLGDGHGGFTQTISGDTGDATKVNIALADADGDGDLDLFFTSAHPGQPVGRSIWVAPNLGDGNFSFQNEYIYAHIGGQLIDLPDWDQATYIAAGNIDQNGLPEVFAGAGYVTVRLAAGQSDRSDYLPQAYGAETRFGQPYMLDYDGDGDLDSFVVSGGSAHYYENVGSGVLVERTGAANPFQGLAPSADSLAFGDLDGDGDLDLLVTQPDGYSYIRWNNSSYGAKSNSLDGSIALHFDLPGAPSLPVADIAQVAENATVAIDVLANDIAAGIAAGQTIASVAGMAIAAGQTITLASGATVTLNPDNTLTYDPGGKFNWLVSSATALLTGAFNALATDSFSYVLSGGGSATVTVTVTGVDGAGDRLLGSVADDVLTGTAAANMFFLQQGGHDHVSGGDGNDGFYFGAAFDALDRVEGGAGTMDQIGLQGDYAAGLTLGADSMTGVEMLVFLPGSDTRFGDTGGNHYSYAITTDDGNVAAGQTLTVQANALRAGENLTFDGSHETDGSFAMYGGLGVDHLTGGQKDDSFYFGKDGRFGPDDTIDGQGGSDQLRLQGDYAGANAVVLAPDQVKSVDLILLASAQDTRFGAAAALSYSYDLTTDDSTVAAGATMTIQAKRLLAGETLHFDGSHETDGAFKVYAGAGDDTILGSAKGDYIMAGAGNDRITGGGGADNMFGGDGNDTFAYLHASDSTAAAPDKILDFSSGDTIDLSALGIGSLIGSGAFGHHAGEVRVEQAGSYWQVEGDMDGDGHADLSILVTATPGYQWSAADFLLATGSPSMAAAGEAGDQRLTLSVASLIDGSGGGAGSDDNQTDHAAIMPGILHFVASHSL